MSASGGQDARWRSDGRELFYTALGGNVMAARVLFPFRKVNPRWPYDVTRDGQRFLAITSSDQSPPPMSVVMNWTSALEP